MPTAQSVQNFGQSWGGAINRLQQAQQKRKREELIQAIINKTTKTPIKEDVFALQDPSSGLASTEKPMYDTEQRGIMELLKSDPGALASFLSNERTKETRPEGLVPTGWSGGKTSYGLPKETTETPTPQMKNYEYLVSLGIDPAKAREMTFKSNDLETILKQLGFIGGGTTGVNAGATTGETTDITGGVLPSRSGLKLKGANIGGLSFEVPQTEEERKATVEEGIQADVAKQKALEKGKGLSVETGGKLAMVIGGLKDLKEVRNMLFPDGTPQSFKRGLATVSNIPLSRAPILGAVIPESLPDSPFWRNASEKGQGIYSRLQNAVAAKLRVETGAQANPSEVENILRRFGVSGASSPQAAFDALNRLEDFFNETIKIIDPTGRFTSGETNIQEETEKEGGQIMIDAQGNKAMVYPDGTYEEIE
jgi:hypothetical protein